MLKTLLHWAIDYDWDISKLDLGDYSSNELNAQDRDGLTAVHIAIVNRNLPALKHLVASGASYMITDKNGMSPVHIAAEQGYGAGINFFIEMPEREFGRTKTGASLLHLLALWSDGDILGRFVRIKQAKLDVVDKQRHTALHYAAMVDNALAAKQLVALGCKLERRNASGMTPLHEAIRSGGVDTVKLLLKKGANTRATDGFDQSCLHLGLRYGHDDATAHFLAMEFDVNYADRFRITPLHRACIRGKVEYIRKLRQHGAKWNPHDKYGRSPIDLAVQHGKFAAVEEMILWLESEDASHHLLDNALTLACELQLKAIEQLLEQSGAEVDRTKIKEKWLYLPGPVRGPNRWPLVRYDDSRPEANVSGKGI
ncbi:hypothetical protein Sste5346_010469 [Sporothrix stenoceras]|uniref:Ankyrin repeat protein n=1 Tax=Sporothrix stenoceras TaxID=5173 RepID=A0ABR3YGU6_9PEZI